MTTYFCRRCQATWEFDGSSWSLLRSGARDMNAAINGNRLKCCGEEVIVSPDPKPDPLREKTLGEKILGLFFDSE